MSYIDLHVHSNHSDGTCTPTELVKLAVEIGLSAFALTDHDTVSGVAEALEAAKDCPVTVIPGVEMSSKYEGKDVHILGYYVQHDNPAFVEKLQYYQKKREERNILMIQKMQQYGIEITEESFFEMFPDAIITRAHFASYLMKKGYTKSVKEGFDNYIGSGKPCYVPKEIVTPEQAMECIAIGHGIPVLAHPMLCHFNEEQMDTLLKKLIAMGLIGIETMYSENSKEEEEKTRELAQKYGLVMTGGSDFHGKTKPYIQLGTGKGNLKIPEKCIEELLEAVNLI